MRLPRRRRGGKPGQLKAPLILKVLITVFAVVMVLPLIYILVNSLKPLDELLRFPPPPWVEKPTMNNFRDLILAASTSVVPFTRYIFNSVFTSSVTVVVSLVIGAMFAFPLGKQRFPGKRALDFLLVASLMFTPEVIQIPRYLVVNGLRMIDTYWALIIPSLAFTLGVFLLRQFVVSFPDALIESAKIDGATDWQVFWRLVVPYLRPGLATAAVLAFQAAWNDSYGPMLFLRSEAMKTLPIAIATIMGASSIARIGAQAAAGFVMILPPVLLFVLMQANVLRTFAYSGIKS